MAIAMGEGEAIQRAAATSQICAMAGMSFAAKLQIDELAPAVSGNANDRYAIGVSFIIASRIGA